MLRSIVAIVAGYLTMTLVVVSGQVTLYALGRFPQPGQAATGYFIFSLAVDAFAALLGGFMAATIAQRLPIRHAAFLALLAFAVGAHYTRMLWDTPPPERPPHEYLIARLVIATVFIFLGGLARLHIQRGITEPRVDSTS